MTRDSGNVEDPDEDHPRETAYELGVSREFVAQHFLTVPDPEPPEGEVHSHYFTVEVEFGAADLGTYGYVVNINEVEAILDALESRYRDTLLNDLPEFEGLNPSVEHFSRLFGDRVAERLSDGNPETLAVRIWEDETGWASHTRQLG